MGRQKNDGRGRMGGRAKGTPNKTTATVKDWLSKLLEDNRRQIESDLKAIEPAERVRLYAALLNYVIPKQQAVTVEAAMQAEYEELTKLLKTAPDAAIDKIADRIKEIEGYNNGQ
jgi:hypothetical protein